MVGFLLFILVVLAVVLSELRAWRNKQMFALQTHRDLALAQEEKKRLALLGRMMCLATRAEEQVTADADFDYLWGQRHAVLYRVELSALYHQKRERFFEATDKMIKAVAVIGGSAALAKIGGAEWLMWIAAGITVSSTCSLVFGLSDRSRRHAELARNFRLLESEIVAKGERDFTEADIAAWCAKERLLETSEPPALGNLVRICQNELAVAQGQPAKVCKVGFFRALFAHLVDLPLAKA